MVAYRQDKMIDAPIEIAMWFLYLGQTSHCYANCHTSHHIHYKTANLIATTTMLSHVSHEYLVRSEYSFVHLGEACL